jgi:peroxiredoxin Q/BCP
MKPLSTPVALALAACAAALPARAQQPTGAPTEPLAVGAAAPDFALRGATRYGTLAQPIRLSDFRGKTVVLAFFYKARTRGCTIQMDTYRDRYPTLFQNGQNVVLIAISTDPADTLAAWARDHQFQYLFASDTGAAVGRLYGAAVAGRVLDNRNLFVVGPEGTIVYRQVPFREIDPTAYTELATGLGKVLAP